MPMTQAEMRYGLFPIRPHLRVLMWHDVGTVGGGLQAHYIYVRGVIAELARRGFRFCSAAEVEQWVQGALTLPEKSVWLTFDDGMAGLYTYLVPILRQYRARGSVALITDKTDIHPSYLTSAQIAAMQDVCDFVIHCHHGHDLIASGGGGETGPFYGNRKWLVGESRLETDAEFIERVRSDILTAQTHIAAWTGTKPNLLLWPFGSYGVTKDGYTANDPEHVPALLNAVLEEIGIAAAWTYNMADSGRETHDLKLDHIYHAPRIFAPDTGNFESISWPERVGVPVKAPKSDPAYDTAVTWPGWCRYGSGYLAARWGRLMVTDANMVAVGNSFLPTGLPDTQLFPAALDSGDVWVNTGFNVYRVDMQAQAVTDSFALGAYALNLVTDGIYGYVVTETGTLYKVDFTAKTCVSQGAITSGRLSNWAFYRAAYWEGHIYLHDVQARLVHKVRLSDRTIVKTSQLPVRYAIGTPNADSLAGVAFAEDDLMYWFSTYRGAAIERAARLLV